MAVLLLAAPGLVALGGCVRSVDGVPTAASVTALPDSAEELEPLIVATVPSGLPRLPDHELEPPAGEKRVEDIAQYADDPGREREVLQQYGYRFGWERFWGTGSGGPVTGVFVDQFDRRAGADAYAADLASNDADHYRGMLTENAPGFPGGCHLLTVEDAEPEAGLTGPAAFVWCGHGVFSVSVTSVADSVDAAEDEVRTVLAEQLDRLPPG